MDDDSIIIINQSINQSNKSLPDLQITPQSQLFNYETNVGKNEIKEMQFVVEYNNLQMTVPQTNHYHSVLIGKEFKIITASSTDYFPRTKLQ